MQSGLLVSLRAIYIPIHFKACTSFVHEVQVKELADDVEAQKRSLKTTYDFQSGETHVKTDDMYTCTLDYS